METEKLNAITLRVLSPHEKVNDELTRIRKELTNKNLKVIVSCLILVLIFQVFQYVIDQSELNRKKTLMYVFGMTFCLTVFCLTKLSSLFMHILMIVPFIYTVQMAYLLEYETIHD